MLVSYICIILFCFSSLSLSLATSIFNFQADSRIPRVSLTLLEHLRDINITAMMIEDAVETVKKRDAVLEAKEKTEPGIIGTLLEYLSAMGMVWKSIAYCMYAHFDLCANLLLCHFFLQCSSSFHSVPATVYLFILNLLSDS